MELDVSPEEIQSKLRLLRPRHVKRPSPLGPSSGQQLQQQTSGGTAEPSSPCFNSPLPTGSSSSKSPQGYHGDFQASNSADAPRSPGRAPVANMRNFNSPIRSAGALAVSDSSPPRAPPAVGQTCREALAPYAYSYDVAATDEASIFQGRELARSDHAAKSIPRGGAPFTPTASAAVGVAPRSLTASVPSNASVAADDLPHAAAANPSNHHGVGSDIGAARRMQRPPPLSSDDQDLSSPGLGRRGSNRSRPSAADVQGHTSMARSVPSATEHARGSTASSIGSERSPDRGVEGPHYLTWDELPPFVQPPDDRFVCDSIDRLSGNASASSPASPGGRGQADWSSQFRAMDDVRRLARYAPRLLMGANGSGRLRKVVASVATLADSLRSALAKNALRSVSELFSAFGTSRCMDLELEGCLQVAFKRAADTNTFISEEAEAALREICKAATETKLLAPLISTAANRQAKIRERALRCLAMLSQRLALRGPTANRDLKSIAEIAAKALSDASPDVRQSARLVGVVLERAYADGLLDDCSAVAKLQSALPPGIDPSTFDAFDPDAAFQRTTPSSAQGGSRGFSWQGIGVPRSMGSPKS